MKLRQVSLTHVGMVRKENQDSVFAEPELGVFMVADGMGGEKAGAEASAQVIATVARVTREFFEGQAAAASPVSLEEMARKALQKASEEVFQISVREPEKTGMGSTGSLLFLHRGVYFVAQVGDSRVYLVRDGKVRQITRDHTIVYSLYENGILTRDQLETHPERHLLTQCIGAAKPVEVDLFADKVNAGDMFLICSDGLTGYAGEAQVAELLLDPSFASLEDQAQKLLQAALDGGGGDNVSVVLVVVDALDPSDDWNVDESAIPKMAPDVVSPPPVSLERTHPSVILKNLPRKRGNLAIVAGVFLLLFLIELAVLRTRKVETTLAITSNVLLKDSEVAIRDSKGKALRGEGFKRNGNNLTAKLRRGAVYNLELTVPGLPVLSRKFKAPRSSNEFLEIRMEFTGRLKIAVPSRVQIDQIKIEADGKAIYEYSREKGGEPELEHELPTGVPCQIEISSKADGTSSQQAELKPGEIKTISF